MQDVLRQTATELGQSIGAGRLDPRDLTEAVLDAASAHPYRDRIFTLLTPEIARAQAASAADRARSGLRRSPLDGVPISWKDLFDTAGLPTEAGSALLRGRIPSQDAEVLQNASRAGLVMIGKTHMTELAFSGLGLNPVTATPPNINNPDLVAGGSSSGAATSVAFGLAIAAIGSDTGGSVRVPAAWNDLVGLKTTAGRLSLNGVVPLIPSFDTVGPLARSVEDAATLAAILGDERLPDLTPPTLSGRRFLVCNTIALDDLRHEPGMAFNFAINRLGRLGARLEMADFPEIGAATALAGPLFAAEAYATWHREIEARPELMFAPIRERFRSGAAFSAVQNLNAWTELHRLRRSFWQRAQGTDAILMPTSAVTPPDAARLLADPDYFSAENLLALRNTRIGNLMGGCALTLPSGVPSCGLMVLAAPGQDIAVSRLAISMQAALR